MSDFFIEFESDVEATDASRDVQFVFSEAGTVHERPATPDDEHPYAFDPKCGQTLPPGSHWGRIDAESAEAVARKYGKTQFCSKCFHNSLRLGRIGREARENGGTGD